MSKLEMTDNPDEMLFGDLLENVVDNRGKTCPTANSGIPLIATNCIKNDSLYPVFENLRYVSQDTYDNWFRGHPKPGDMIFVTKGTPGRVCWVPDPVNFCIAQDMVAIRANENKVYPKYLFAVLRAERTQAEIENLHVGSLIPHFKKGDFNDLHIPVPEPQMQKYIGDMYFDMSLKIDLLHRQNRTLEKMEETLFRQWFIEEAEEQWEEATIKDVCVTITKGTTPTTLGKSFTESGVNFLKAEAITDEGDLIETKFAHIDEDTHGLLNRSKLQESDVVITIAGTIGRVALIPKWILPANTNQALAILRINTEMIFPEFVYLLLKSNDVRNDFEGRVVHAVQPNLSLGEIGDLPFKVPPEQYLAKVKVVIKDIVEKKARNSYHMRTLTQMRDTLLPKLMSGEIRVPV